MSVYASWSTNISFAFLGEVEPTCMVSMLIMAPYPSVTTFFDFFLAITLRNLTNGSYVSDSSFVVGLAYCERASWVLSLPTAPKSFISQSASFFRCFDDETGVAMLFYELKSWLTSSASRRETNFETFSKCCTTFAYSSTCSFNYLSSSSAISAVLL